MSRSPRKRRGGACLEATLGALALALVGAWLGYSSTPPFKPSSPSHVVGADLGAAFEPLIWLIVLVCRMLAGASLGAVAGLLAGGLLGWIGGILLGSRAAAPEAEPPPNNPGEGAGPHVE